MRKKFLLLCNKLNQRFITLYTWLLRGSLKSCGERVQFHFPVRMEGADSISVGAGTIIYSRSWLNVVKGWAGVQHNGQIQLGERVSISYGCQISAAELVVLEDEVAIAAGVVIVDHTHDPHYPDIPVFRAPLTKPAPVRIGKGTFIGIGAFVGPGVQIGEHCVVSANAVVIRDVPAFSIAAGNPARAVRYLDSDAKGSAASALTGVERG